MHQCPLYCVLYIVQDQIISLNGISCNLASKEKGKKCSKESLRKPPWRCSFFIHGVILYNGSLWLPQFKLSVFTVC